MPKLKFKKIEIISLLKDSTEILNLLQRRGVVQLTNTKDELLTKIDAAGSIKKYEETIKKSQIALDTLQNAIQKKESFFDSLKGKKRLSSADFKKRAEKTKEILKKIRDIESCIKKIADEKKNISKLKVSLDTLLPWKNLEFPLDTKETKDVVVLLGMIIKKDEVLKKSYEQKICLELDVIEKTSAKKTEKNYVAVYIHKAHKNKAIEILNEFGFEFFSYTSSLTPENETAELKKKIEKAYENIKESEEKIRSYKPFYNDIEFLIDYYTLKKDKYSEIKKLSITKNTVVIKGFVPEIYSISIKNELENNYPSAIIISDLNEDDSPPVLLSNNSFISAVEGITEMYALPDKNDVDPNPVMAFFYYLFFGMMLSDAGYGLIITATMFYLLRFTDVEGTMRRSFRLFFYCGISTFFWGILFGSWFGDLPQVIAKEFFRKEIVSTALWFEPLENPIILLLFSFGLGIIHLFAGLYMRFKILYDSGQKTDAYCEVFPVFVTILGASPLGAGILTEVPPFLKTIGMYFLIIGAVSVILTSKRSTKNIFIRFFGGIYGLYNVATGYLSDILSYSRLLALGLATGSIASVINLIAVMPESIFLKALMLIIVGLIGHTANLGINLLGAYVHADRLQFVELFSKFYKGGGEAFSPLKANTKYYIFEKENIYE